MRRPRDEAEYLENANGLVAGMRAGKITGERMVKDIMEPSWKLAIVHEGTLDPEAFDFLASMKAIAYLIQAGVLSARDRDLIAFVAKYTDEAQKQKEAGQ